MAYETEQEEFWAGEFGNEYIKRNSDELVPKTSLFAEIISHMPNLQKVLEFGPNIGLNLDAIKLLRPNAECTGVEINANAYEKLHKKHPSSVNSSIFDFEAKEKYDFVFTSGVLIHINPDKLDDVYEKMWNASSRFILVSEYYNPTPVVINYRGSDDKLFKRDFAGEMMDKYDLELRAYGFRYHRDPNFPIDDATWFLMEKK